MRKIITTMTMVAALSGFTTATAFATTPPDDPNDVEAIDNPLDDNDESGFDDWGLLGLLGLLGLAGLRPRRDNTVVVRDDTSTRTR